MFVCTPNSRSFMILDRSALTSSKNIFMKSDVLSYGAHSRYERARDYSSVDNFSGPYQNITGSARVSYKTGLKTMPDECLRKDCAICGHRIQGENWYCPHCKLCLCFFCGMQIVVEEHTMDPLCPACGNKLI
jgi:predicted RNA-binding Zn-ribbon protein involved in translation (DUF1610 family)